MVQFVFVYILEAHACDEWPVGNRTIQLEQHKTIASKIAAAKLLQDKYPINCHVVVDSEEDTFVNVFCSWPFRFWIVHNNKVQLKCMPDGHNVNINTLETWLHLYKQRNS